MDFRIIHPASRLSEQNTWLTKIPMVVDSLSIGHSIRLEQLLAFEGFGMSHSYDLQWNLSKRWRLSYLPFVYVFRPNLAFYIRYFSSTFSPVFLKLDKNTSSSFRILLWWTLLLWIAPWKFKLSESLILQSVWHFLSNDSWTIAIFLGEISAEKLIQFFWQWKARWVYNEISDLYADFIFAATEAAT